MRYTARSANTQPIRRIHQNLNKMKILIVASDKGNKFAPFIEEQIAALQQVGVEIIRYGVTGKGITGYLRELPALRRLIRSERPDIIHAHYGLCGLLANLQRLVPVVTTYHGSDINVPKILHFSRIAMRLSAYNIFVSRRNLAIALCSGAEAPVYGIKDAVYRPSACVSHQGCSVQGKGKENSGAVTSAHTQQHSCDTQHVQHANTLYTKRYALLPCGVNIPNPWSELKDQKVEQLTLNQWVQSVLSEDVKNVLFAGAFDNAVKDPELAKAAVEIAQAQIEDNKIKENINNQQHRQLDSTTLRANQHPCAIHEIRLVELKGYTREQVNALMYNCEVLLMTSRTEGSPQVIKEALACGCPIVSVDVGDVAERTSGVDGCYLVRTREPKDIADALLQAIAYKGRTNGRERILEMGLSNDQVAKQLLRIYEQLLV